MKARVERSGAMNARSWLLVGEEIVDPKLGDIVVFWRESLESWKGHVGIFIGFSEDKRRVFCLGGNQRNKVCILPYDAERVLGYRRLKKQAMRGNNTARGQGVSTK